MTTWNLNKKIKDGSTPSHRFCSKCKIKKEISAFGKSTDTAYGVRSRCRQCHNEDNKKYIPGRKKYMSEYMREYRVKNKKKLRAHQRGYNINKRKVDPSYVLRKALRSRINMAIRGTSKAGSAVRDLGCTVEYLKGYIESKFTPGMNWSNYGIKGWHIDHITPLCSFNLEDRSEFLRACHYSNLQPLWAHENFKKGGRVYSASGVESWV